MASRVVDEGFDPRVFVDCEGFASEPKAGVSADFEAGLSVIIEAMPNMSAVVDRFCNVVAANRASRALIGMLNAPDMRSTVSQSVKAACRSGRPAKMQIDFGRVSQDVFLVVPLTAQTAGDRGLFLLTEALNQRPDNGTTAGSNAASPFDFAGISVRLLRKEAARLKHLSETDPLTGALNVRAFASRVTQSLAAMPQRGGALIFLDLNRFKEINDRFGHAAGDAVLMHVVSRLTFPTHTNVMTARMGGDEFALWMSGIEPETLRGAVETVHARLRKPVDLSKYDMGRRRITVSAAIGAVCYPKEAANYEAMRHLADKRMYKDKLLHRAATTSGI